MVVIICILVSPLLPPTSDTFLPDLSFLARPLPRRCSPLLPYFLHHLPLPQVGGLTEITSNVATANILLPVLAEVRVVLICGRPVWSVVNYKRLHDYIHVFLALQLAKATHTNPLYLMIPATVTCR